MPSLRRDAKRIGFDRLESRLLLTVIGADNRTQVGNTTSFPFSAVARVIAYFGDNTQLQGSGTLIDAYHVLTSGSVVYQPGHGGFATRIEVIPGQDGSHDPFGEAWATYMRVSDTSGNTLPVGLITLDRNIGNETGWLGMEYQPDGFYNGISLNAAGYPQDLSSDGVDMYTAFGPIGAVGPDDIPSDAGLAVAVGEEGGPLFRHDPTTSDNYVDGVIYSFGSDNNDSVRITQDLINYIESSIAADHNGDESGGQGLGLTGEHSLDPVNQPELSDLDSVQGSQLAGFSPASVSPGDAFSVQAAVLNQGQTQANTGTVSFYATTSTDPGSVTSGYFLGSMSLPALAASNSTLAATTVTIPANLPPGNYYLGWTIGAGSQGEYSSDHPNGVLTSSQFTVNPPPQSLSGGNSGPQGNSSNGGVSTQTGPPQHPQFPPASGQKKFVPGDFDGDGKADQAVYSNGVLTVKLSGGGTMTVPWGGPQDHFVVGDFDGDGKEDVAVYGYGRLAVLLSGGGTMFVPFGGPADQFVSGDFDGDGKTDVAVYGYGRLAYIPSSGGPVQYIPFGGPQDQFVSGDFDGDGKSDLAVYGYGRLAYRPSSGGPDVSIPFGGPADQFVSGDFDGDGKTDLAVYGYGRLAYRPSSGGPDVFIPFGGPQDQFIAGDFNGDGKTDVAVYGYGRFAEALSGGGFVAQAMGDSSSIPVLGFVKKRPNA